MEGHWCEDCRGFSNGPCTENDVQSCEICGCEDVTEPDMMHPNGTTCDERQCGRDHETCTCSCHTFANYDDGEERAEALADAAMWEREHFDSDAGR